MLKELKYLLFLIVIVLFFFLSFKYYFSNENKKNSLYCAKHKLDGMINIRSKKCIINNCKITIGKCKG